MRNNIVDEQNRPIGWSDDTGSCINYFTYSYGHIGTYDKTTKTYRRFKAIPGKPIVPFAGTGDYGEADVRYWGK